MGYILIILLLLVVTWPFWRRWFYSYLQRRTEDTIRRMMGMPSRKEEERRRKAQQKREERSNKSAGGQRRRTSRNPFYETRNESIIPPEYAEDVEFTEIKEFQQTIISDTLTGNNDFQTEHQVEDVEFKEEIIQEKRKSNGK